MSAKHTPGPWKADGTYILDANGFEVGQVEETCIRPDWETLGLSHWAHGPGTAFIERTEDEVEANAHLFAAAPDLLAAAKTVLAGLNARIDAATDAGESVPVFEGIASLYEAIAKAEAASGDQP